MNYFTVEIAGRPIAAFRAADLDTATELFTDEDFREDLTALESAGTPLWDGEAAISLREATAAERQEVDEANEEDDGLSEDEDEFIVFLVDVDETEEDDEDDVSVQ